MTGKVRVQKWNKTDLIQLGFRFELIRGGLEVEIKVPDWTGPTSERVRMCLQNSRDGIKFVTARKAKGSWANGYAWMHKALPVNGTGWKTILDTINDPRRHGTNHYRQDEGYAAMVASALLIAKVMLRRANEV